MSDATSDRVARAIAGATGPPMHWLWVIVVLLVALGSVLAMAETSVSRMTRVRALTLRDAGRRNAEVLDRIEENPPRT
jgi:CBS domain containing-hemolysin-like protein